MKTIASLAIKKAILVSYFIFLAVACYTVLPNIASKASADFESFFVCYDEERNITLKVDRKNVNFLSGSVFSYLDKNNTRQYQSIPKYGFGECRTIQESEINHYFD